MNPALDVGIEIGVPIVKKLANLAGKRLEPSEDEAVRTQLLASIKSLQHLPPWRHPLKRRKAKKNNKEVTSQLKVKLKADECYASLADGDWREEIINKLTEVAESGIAHSGDAPSPWLVILRSQKPRDWAKSVTFAFDARLRRDEKLKYLVQTLDYRKDLAGQAILSLAVQDMARSLRTIAWVSLALAAAITGSAEIVPHFWH